MNNQAPIIEPAGDTWSEGWISWFAQIFRALLGWKFTYTTSLNYDFGSVSAQSELSTTTTVKRRPDANVPKVGDAVLVTPSINTAGIIYTGIVTADNTVTVYAKNFTAGAINPASTTFRIIVFQN